MTAVLIPIPLIVVHMLTNVKLVNAFQYDKQCTDMNLLEKFDIV